MMIISILNHFYKYIKKKNIINLNYCIIFILKTIINHSSIISKNIIKTEMRTTSSIKKKTEEK
jgi:hypothetical protein